MMNPLLLATLALVSCSSQPALTRDLCVVPETTYFACQTKSGKWINLCGMQPEALQYRFGTHARLELSYPVNAAQGPGYLRIARYSRYRVERVEVSFSNHDTDYALFDYQEDTTRRAGVRVTTRDGKEREIACFSPIKARLAELQPILPCDTDNALNGGNCP